MNTKTKKVFNILINVLIVFIAIIIIFVIISSISSKSKGYTTIFGKTVYAVKSPSMDGDKPDSFKKNALIIVKELSMEEKKNLEVGDIITFWTSNITGKMELNTHRIVEKNNNEIVSYKTKGDNLAATIDTYPVIYSDIVGVYEGKINGIGGFVLFVQSPTGFFVLVVLPSLLILAYCIYAFVKGFKAYQLERNPKRVASIKESEREAMRQEILAELEKDKNKEEEENDKK